MWLLSQICYINLIALCIVRISIVTNFFFKLHFVKNTLIVTVLRILYSSFSRNHLAVTLSIFLFSFFTDVIEYDAKLRWTLPHWCVFIGYLCCLCISAFSCVVVITYGQQFGYDLSMKWLQSLLFGFLEDFFLTFPFVVSIISIDKSDEPYYKCLASNLDNPVFYSNID